MISINTPQKFCNEDVSLIENYNEAINSNDKWDCHHKLEIKWNVSKKWLIDNNLYYNRPASELIFLPQKEHLSMHRKGKRLSEETRKKLSEVSKGRPSPMKGKHHTEEARKKMSEASKGNKSHLGFRLTDEQRKKISDNHSDVSGKNNPMYGVPSPVKGKHWKIIDGKRVYY